MNQLIKNIEDIALDICTDLRPRSIIDKQKFNHLYELFKELKSFIVENKVLFIPNELIETLVYLSDGIIVQCNFSSNKEHLISEWKTLNNNILDLFNLCFEDNHKINLRYQDLCFTGEIEIKTAWSLFATMYELIINSDLYLSPQNFAEAGSLYKTKDKNLIKYWDIRNKVQDI
jgi:hypothetical protein